MTDLTPYPIYTRNSTGEHLLGYACPECGQIFIDKTPRREIGIDSAESLARECCTKKCTTCNVEPPDTGWTICRACRKKRDDEKDQETFDRAAKIDIDDYGDWVYDPWRDKYHADMYDLLDDYDEPSSTPITVSELFPPYFYACSEDKFNAGDVDVLDYVQSCIGDNHHEGAIDLIKDETALEEFVAAWCNKQEIVSFNSDYSRALVVNWKRGDKRDTDESE